MAISKLFLKGFAGVSATSAVSLGGVGIYESSTDTNSIKKWDESVLNSGTWSAVKDDNSNPRKITVSVDSTDAKINNNKSWTWECIVRSVDENPNLDEKFGDLQTKLVNPGNNKNSRSWFVKNCARHRNIEQKEEAQKDLLTGNTPKLTRTVDIKMSDFDKLFTEEINKPTI